MVRMATAQTRRRGKVCYIQVAVLLRTNVLSCKAPKKAFLEATPLPSPSISRPTTPIVNHLLTGTSGPKGSRRSRKAVNTSSAPASSGDESPARPGSKKGANSKGQKVKRVWTADGLADEDDGTTLDYSAPATETERAATTVDSTGQETWGTRTKTGQYMPKDIDEQMGAILASAKSGKEGGDTSGIVGSSLGAVSGLFRNFVGGKTLTKEDLEKPMKGIEDHLLKKNVAREAAVRLCDSVERDLIGMKTSSFTSKSFILVSLACCCFMLWKCTQVAFRLHTNKSTSTWKTCANIRKMYLP